MAKNTFTGYGRYPSIEKMCSFIHALYICIHKAHIKALKTLVCFCLHRGNLWLRPQHGNTVFNSVSRPDGAKPH